MSKMVLFVTVLNLLKHTIILFQDSDIISLIVWILELFLCYHITSEMYCYAYYLYVASLNHRSTDLQINNDTSYLPSASLSKVDHDNEFVSTELVQDWSLLWCCNSRDHLNLKRKGVIKLLHLNVLITWHNYKQKRRRI